MKRKTKTDTPTQPTAEEHNALVRIHHATAGEDRWKCGLEYICNRLDDARGYAEDAAERILPDVADVKLNPAPTLESLCATPPEWRNAVKLSELCERIFDQLKKEIAIKPDVELLRRKRINWHGETRLEEFALSWIVFLFGWNGNGGLGALMRKKIALAQAIGKRGAAGKLTDAFNQLPPAFQLTDLKLDVRRFADEITPDDFHIAFRNAMKLDAEATAEINGEGKFTDEETTPDLLKVLADTKRQVERNGRTLEKVRRTVRGEDTKGQNGGRPRKPGAEKMILNVIQCAVDKLRPQRSHYADHVFRDWTGERPYKSAHSLFTSTKRYLANNDLPELPTTADAQEDFALAIKRNTVISQKLEAHKLR